MFNRSRLLKGYTRKVQTGEGNVYITVTHDSEGVTREVFATRGKGGTCDAAHIDALTRMISLLLQNDVRVEPIIHQLKGIVCHPAYDVRKVGSVADAIALALEEDNQRFNEEVDAALDGALASYKSEVDRGQEESVGNMCPDCNQMAMVPQGGRCEVCQECGFSNC